MVIKSTHWSENRLLYLGGCFFVFFYFTTGRASATDCERYKKYLSSPPLNEKYFLDLVLLFSTLVSLVVFKSTL